MNYDECLYLLVIKEYFSVSLPVMDLSSGVKFFQSSLKPNLFLAYKALNERDQGFYITLFQSKNVNNEPLFLADYQLYGICFQIENINMLKLILSAKFDGLFHIKKP